MSSDGPYSRFNSNLVQPSPRRPDATLLHQLDYPASVGSTGTSTGNGHSQAQAHRSTQPRDSTRTSRLQSHSSSSLAPPSYMASVSRQDGLTPRSGQRHQQSGPASRRSAQGPGTDHGQRSTFKPSRNHNYPYQSMPLGQVASWASATALSESRTSRKTTRRTAGPYDTASESGMSIMSALHPKLQHATTSSNDVSRERRRMLRAYTDSPLRRWAKWIEPRLGGPAAVILALSTVILVKWVVGLGSYSGQMSPPMRGDFEAQRHWMSITVSSLPARYFYATSNSPVESVPSTRWYYHDLSYWGLDYPPLTAYHSLLLGAIARLSAKTAHFVTLRPSTTSSQDVLQAWEQSMMAMERDGSLKTWMRTTVIVGDLLVWLSASGVYCYVNYARDRKGKTWRPVLVTMFSIWLQPALLLIDNGHFQYNSIMLGFTTWAMVCFQSGHDLLGAVAFVLALGFKQMALYYSPAVFAYLLGKCLYLGGRQGLSLFISLAFTVLATFAILLAPWLSSITDLQQVVHRVFPFARGLFEDKVANVWCALNVVVKLRSVASIGTLAKLSLAVTFVAVVPSVVGLVWVSWTAGQKQQLQTQARGGDKTPGVGVGVKQQRDGENDPKRSSTAPTGDAERAPAATTPAPAPTIVLLPHALFVSALAFFLFSFQVHEKSILLPLMPLTLLSGAREAGYGRMDWEWAVLLNNVGVYSMWPLLKRDGLGLEYCALTLGWNCLIGYNPLELKSSFVKYLSLSAYAGLAFIHVVELVASPPRHLPDLFVVMNVALSVTVFGLGFLWGSKRLVQEGWAVAGL